MKSPDDNLARKARLRREHVEAFMRGDMETWQRTMQELGRILRAEGVRERRSYDRRIGWKRQKKA